MKRWFGYGKIFCVCLLLGASLAGCSSPEKAGEEAYAKGDYATAMQKFKASGSAKSTFYLGLMALKGEGMPQDLEGAVRLISKAADEGYGDAQFNLGSMYANGQGVPQNKQTALEWYGKAAAQGNSLAEFNIGLMYIVGDGVRQDKETGIAWIRKAADHGNERAKGALQSLTH